MTSGNPSPQSFRSVRAHPLQGKLDLSGRKVKDGTYTPYSKTQSWLKVYRRREREAKDSDLIKAVGFTTSMTRNTKTDGNNTSIYLTGYRLSHQKCASVL